MKKYTLEVVIEEGNDEYWEDLLNQNVTGCDEMIKYVKESLFDWNPKITLIKFENKND
jgi:hypothetical protein